MKPYNMRRKVKILTMPILHKLVYNFSLTQAKPKPSTFVCLFLIENNGMTIK